MKFREISYPEDVLSVPAVELLYGELGYSRPYPDARALRPLNNQSRQNFCIEAGQLLAVGSLFVMSRPDQTWPAEQTNQEAWVSDIAVDPNKRKQGIGRLLMANLEEVARNNGLPSVSVYPIDEESATFYERVGYRQLASDRYRLYKHL